MRRRSFEFRKKNRTVNSLRCQQIDRQRSQEQESAGRDRAVGNNSYQAVPERRKTTANHPAINAAAMMMRYFVFSEMRSNIMRVRYKKDGRKFAPGEARRAESRGRGEQGREGEIQKSEVRGQKSESGMEVSVESADQQTPPL